MEDSSQSQAATERSIFFFLIPLPLFQYRKRSSDQAFDRASVPPAWRFKRFTSQHSHQTQETHALPGWQPSPAHALQRNTSCLRNWESKLEWLHFFKPVWHVWAACNAPRCYFQSNAIFCFTYQLMLIVKNLVPWRIIWKMSTIDSKRTANSLHVNWKQLKGKSHSCIWVWMF